MTAVTDATGADSQPINPAMHRLRGLMNAPAPSPAPAPEPGLGRRVASEMVGTFALVFAGCGAIVVDASHGGAIGHVGISLTFGLVVMVMIYAVGHIGGAHFNPAVTVAFASAGHFAWRDVPAYIIGQCVAATAAAFLIIFAIGGAANAGATAPAVGLAAAAVIEFVLTFFLMFVIAAVATDARAVGNLAGVAIGGTVALGALMGGPLSGASLNPARSLGPALASGSFDALWLYLIVPVLGAVAAAGTYRLIR